MSKQDSASAIHFAIDVQALARAVAAELRASGSIGTAPQRRLFSPREAAVVLGFSPSKLYGLVKLGLPTIRVGAQQRVDIEEAVAWLRVHGAGVDQ